MGKSLDELITELIDARQAEKEAKARKESATAEILEKAGGAAFLDTENYRVMITNRSRIDLDQAAVMGILTDLKKEFPKLVTWKEIKPQAKTDAEKAAALATA
jgi:hypothetical protein